MGSQWEYRTVLHTNTGIPDDEPYLTVHEFYLEGENYKGYSPEPASPQSPEELEWMRLAFEKKPALEVDDAGCSVNDLGITVYQKSRWLEPNLTQVPKE